MLLTDINHIAFEFIGYPISYVELIGTFFGLISVYLATRTNIWTWATGIVNELFLFILFFQVQLYADMFLQVYFFIVTLYGWYYWKQKPNSNKITSLAPKSKIYCSAIIVVGSLLAGLFFSNIHILLPNFFKIKAAYPFADSLVMVLSLVATILLAKKKIETWYLWIIIDVICVVLFFQKGILFLSIEYFIFLGLATYGYFNWRKNLTNG